MKKEMLLRPFSFALTTLLVSASVSTSARAFDLDSFRDLVANGADTPEKIIAALPEDFRGNAAFVYQSRSIQPGSSSHPRVLLWDEQTGFTLGFNGDPTLKGYKTLEMSGIDRNSGQIHFYEVEFPLKRRRDDPSSVDIREPGVCFACHGQSARPIWHSFPNWPGVYGGFNDLIEGDEISNFESFREIASQDPRYQSVPLPQLASDLQQQGTPIGIENRPNMRFGVLLSRMNALRIRKIFETDDPDKRREILGVFTGCSAQQGSDADQDIQDRATRLLGSMNMTMADLDMNFDHDDPANDHLDFLASYVDGFSTTRELVTYQLFKDWMPQLTNTISVDSLAMTIGGFENAVHPANSAGSAFIQNLDSWGPWLPLNLQSTHATLCGALGL